jgi:hypothetical protein
MFSFQYLRIFKVVSHVKSDENAKLNNYAKMFKPHYYLYKSLHLSELQKVKWRDLMNGSNLGQNVFNFQIYKGIIT